MGRRFKMNGDVLRLRQPTRREVSHVIGWTYFVHAPEVCRVKIGCSQVSPLARLRTFETGCPTRLIGIGVIRGDAYEPILHRRFADLRWNREWFRAEPILMDFIRDLAMPFDAAQGIDDLVMTEGAIREMDRMTVARFDEWFKAREEGHTVAPGRCRSSTSPGASWVSIVTVSLADQSID